MEKNLIQNNGTVDEELLRGFFAGSVRMHVADNGFSHRVVQCLPAEATARQRIMYNVWTAVWTAVCIVMFFASGSIGLIKGWLHSAWGTLAAHVPTISWQSVQTDFTWEWLARYIGATGQTTLMVAFAATVLGAVALYDMKEMR